MAITFKKKEEIVLLREGGKRLALIMKQLKKSLKPGVSALELDRLCESLIFYYKGKPSFKNYKSEAASSPFPASLCVSLNDTVVHGIPAKDSILKEGDIVSLDVGMIYENLYVDMAITVALGKVPPIVKKLIKTVEDSLKSAIKIIKPGKTLGDIGFVISRCIERGGFNVILNLTGHGVGYAVHEDPFVFNFGRPGEGLRLKEGMVLAIEPMASLGSGGIIQNKDGSFRTADRSLSAHFEHSIAVTKNGVLVLTG